MKCPECDDNEELPSFSRLQKLWEESKMYSETEVITRAMINDLKQPNLGKEQEKYEI